MSSWKKDSIQGLYTYFTNKLKDQIMFFKHIIQTSSIKEAIV